MDALPNFELEDFVPDELQNTFRLWGLYPGQKSIFTVIDGHTNDQHEIRHFSTAEFYTFAGYKRTSRRLQNLKDSPQHLQAKQAESNLVSSKTSRPDVFHNFLRSFFENVGVLLNFYSLDLSRQLRFHNYVGKQRAEAELVNIFINGANSKFIMPRDTKWTPQEFTSDNRIPLIAFGRITFSQTMRDTVSGLARRCYKALKTAEKEGLLVVVDIDEYNTSQVCSRCQTIGLRKLRAEINSFFSVLVYDHCTTQTGRRTI
ncbi:MAG: hypothetical protein EXX96DRAFT_643209 [Benjaminiella poitrasii]|nr:MAG: hypothetical protein EXX96DRAFT_643209 [Benjaminiella poitrasii]